MRTAPTVRGRAFRRDATPCGSGGSRDHGASGTRRAWPVAAYSRLPPLPLRIAAGHALVLLLVLATLLSSPPARAVGLPPAAQLAGTPLARVGQGEMRWLGFKLYDAALWAGERGEAAVEAPHVLSIRYARAVSSERLVEVSLDEMRRLGFGDEARLARWGEALAAALPIYVHVPQLYAEGLGLSLALVGAVLLAARIVDAITDPLIGWANDRLPRRRLWIALALPALGAGMVGLLVPPAGAGAMWLFALLVALSLAYSVATIAYNAWGAEVATTGAARTRFVASREGFALAGVVLAAALPGVLAGGEGEAAGLARLAWVFLPLLLVFGGWTLWRAPAPPRVTGAKEPVWAGLRAALGEPGFVRLLAVFAANGIAAAIPSATVLFFVADVLAAAHLAGLFLALYFLAAAASLPLWVRLSQRVGKLRAWLAGMALAVAVFAWAGLLGSGEVFAYGAICVLSGLALGADLSLPPSLLADQIARSRGAGRSAPLAAGACFGWWNFVTKANLAFAAGLALPLLALLGYTPGARDAAAVAALAGVYGFAPLALKLGAITLLWRWRGAIEPGC